MRSGKRQAGFYAAFLTAPGKVLHDVFVYPTQGSHWQQSIGGGDGSEEPGYLVEVDADEADHLVKHMKRHKLRSKFKLRLLDQGELDVWSMWTEDDRWTAHSQAASSEDVISLADCRAPGMGQRLLLPASSSSSTTGSAQSVTDGLAEASLSAYTIRRYLKGVPEGQQEIPRDDSLPMNNNIDLMGGIDFKKGCYLGQELTIRTHHTGVVRRRVLPIALYEHNKEPPEKMQYDQNTNIDDVDAGQELRRDDKRKRSTGKLIARVGNIGLGICRLEQMSDLTVSGEGSSFSPDDRFTVQATNGAEVGVKAFVPDWLRGRIREPKIQKRVE